MPEADSTRCRAKVWYLHHQSYVTDNLEAYKIRWRVHGDGAVTVDGWGADGELQWSHMYLHAFKLALVKAADSTPVTPEQETDHG